MSEFATETFAHGTLTQPDAAERLGVAVTRIRQLVRDGQLLGLRVEGVLHIPADFLADAEVLKGLPGTITLLRDAGYSDEEALHWLYAAQDDLPGTPVDALLANRGREVRRRAQALGF